MDSNLFESRMVKFGKEVYKGRRAVAKDWVDAIIGGVTGLQYKNSGIYCHFILLYDIL